MLGQQDGTHGMKRCSLDVPTKSQYKLLRSEQAPVISATRTRQHGLDILGCSPSWIRHLDCVIFIEYFRPGAARLHRLSFCCAIISTSSSKSTKSVRIRATTSTMSARRRVPTSTLFVARPASANDSVAPDQRS
jgi:hypothetical protein